MKHYAYLQVMAITIHVVVKMDFMVLIVKKVFKLVKIAWYNFNEMTKFCF